MTATDLITCERCGKTTADPDLWDPEAGTGRIFCNACWDVRDTPHRRFDRQAWRDLYQPIGMLCEVHDGTRATVLGVVEDNTGVLVAVRLGDGRLVHKYVHEVFAPDA